MAGGELLSTKQSINRLILLTYCTLSSRCFPINQTSYHHNLNRMVLTPPAPPAAPQLLPRVHEKLPSAVLCMDSALSRDHAAQEATTSSCRYHNYHMAAGCKNGYVRTVSFNPSEEAGEEQVESFYIDGPISCVQLLASSRSNRLELFVSSLAGQWWRSWRFFFFAQPLNSLSINSLSIDL